MAKKQKCNECGVVLKRDEVALSRKLFGIDTCDLYCLPCMADFCECSVDDLKCKIEQFKEEGCTLFQ